MAQLVRIAGYTNPFRGKGQCKAVLLRCMDFRFIEELECLLRKKHELEHGDYDIISLAGGIREIIDGGEDSPVLRAVDVACNEHGAVKIIASTHIDCAAEGRSTRWPSEEEENNFHMNRLIASGEILRHRFPECEIVLPYITWDALYEVHS